MKKTPKAIVATLILVITMALAFGVPKHKYAGTDIITSLNLPQTTPGWNTEDISDEIDPGGKNMYFLGHMLAILLTNINYYIGVDFLCSNCFLLCCSSSHSILIVSLIFRDKALHGRRKAWIRF